VIRFALVLGSLLLTASGCSHDDAAAKASAPIVGEGATFPAPLYDVWIDRYGRQTGAKITYRATGSGSGIQALLAHEVDFAGSESPLTNDQLEQLGDVLHIPMTIAPVAIAYNAQGVPDGLKLTPDVVSAIFLGEAKSWNDPRIAALNPGITLPPKPITIVHRRDGSGTTRVFTEYLSRVSPEWSSRIGSGTKVEWPGGGLSADGNPGMSEIISKAPGTIGYVSLNFARAKRLEMVALQNKAGHFVLPTLDGTFPRPARRPRTASKTPAGARRGDGVDANSITGSRTSPPRVCTIPEAATWRLPLVGHPQRAVLCARAVLRHPPPEVLARAETKLRSLRVDGKALLPDAP
jgi:phosphate transport system substrate-binding protein